MGRGAASSTKEKAKERDMKGGCAGSGALTKCATAANGAPWLLRCAVVTK